MTSADGMHRVHVPYRPNSRHEFSACKQNLSALLTVRVISLCALVPAIEEKASASEAHLTAVDHVRTEISARSSWTSVHFTNSFRQIHIKKPTLVYVCRDQNHKVNTAGIGRAVAAKSSSVSVTLQPEKSDCRKTTGSHNTFNSRYPACQKRRSLAH